MAQATDLRSSIVERLQRTLPELRRRYSVTRLQIYGSVARGDNRPEGDIDLLVEYSRPPSLFEIARLQEELEKLLGRSVDIATPLGMHPRVLAAARAEAIEIGAGA